MKLQSECWFRGSAVSLNLHVLFLTPHRSNPTIHREPALSLGVAFQITNILRDVGEDAEKRERVYLPNETWRGLELLNDKFLTK